MGNGRIPIVTKEAIATRVSSINGCNFCLSIHRKNLEQLGVGPAEIKDMEDGLVEDRDLSCSLRFVGIATEDPGKLEDADFDDLRPFGYTDEDILEVLTVMEMYTGYNKIIIALALREDD